MSIFSASIRSPETKRARPKTERERDADRKRFEREAGRLVIVPKCADPNRRSMLEGEDPAWLAWYIPNLDTVGPLFSYTFTAQQMAMIQAIQTAIIHGGDQAIAASRGEGKTALFEALLLKYVLAGVVPFGILFASTGRKAEDSLETIKAYLTLGDRLFADYPEVCAPIRDLRDTPHRAHYQICSGFRHDNNTAYDRARSKFKWCGEEIYLPRVPGSPSSGAIIATRGLDAEVRGLKKLGRRPVVAGIDDPDTEQTVRTELQKDKLIDRIDRGIAGLGSQTRRIGRVMLTTLQRPDCASAHFTDPTAAPSWKGRRFRFLEHPPSRTDLWDEYMQLRDSGLQARGENGQDLDPYARAAHKFYLDHRPEMDAGAEVANPNRFDGRKLADGSTLEASALQFYYNEVARIGQNAVSTEYDNDPPEESGTIESGITSHLILQHMSGYDRLAVPPGCAVITQGIDVGKYALHFVVRGWKPDGTGYVIDKGVQDVTGTRVGQDVGVEHAILQALRARMEVANSGIYRTIDDKVVPIDLTLVDAAYKTDAVYAFCREAGLSVKPAMGIGKSSGCVRVRFTEQTRATPDRKPGFHCFMTRQKKGVWLVNMETDAWKEWEHARWLTATDKPGTMFLYGTPTANPKRRGRYEKEHFTYAKHICAEIEVEEPVKGVLVRRWQAKSDTNHFFDASYMTCCAAGMKGIRLLGTGKSGKHEGGWFAAQEKRKRA